MNESQCRAAVLARADGRCERCGRVAYVMSHHHRRNRSQLHKSRHWEVENLSYLCGDGVRTEFCHGWVGANPQAAHDEGWHLHSWEEAAAIPVKHIRYGWVRLLSDGGFVEVSGEELAPDSGDVHDTT